MDTKNRRRGTSLPRCPKINQITIIMKKVTYKLTLTYKKDGESKSTITTIGEYADLAKAREALNASRATIENADEGAEVEGEDDFGCYLTSYLTDDAYFLFIHVCYDGVTSKERIIKALTECAKAHRAKYELHEEEFDDQFSIMSTSIPVISDVRTIAEAFYGTDGVVDAQPTFNCTTVFLDWHRFLEEVDEEMLASALPYKR